jgi:hypothetical protein
MSTVLHSSNWKKAFSRRWFLSDSASPWAQFYRFDRISLRGTVSVEFPGI